LTKKSFFPISILNVFFYQLGESIGKNQLPVFTARCQHGVLDMFLNFLFRENHKITDNSTTAKAKEKISTVLKSSEFLKNFVVHFTKF